MNSIHAHTSRRSPLSIEHWLATLALALLVALLASPSSALAGTLQQVSSFGTNPGNLIMYRYVPASASAGAPLVVVLHGCSQTAGQYTQEAGWYKLADEHGIILVAAEQKTINNSSRCFNWFELGDITRGQGEAQSIRSMVQYMLTNHDIDPARIHVTGLSAGGAMTAVMLATYPEVFAGGAIMAGIPYKCATSMSAAFSCMSGVNKTPTEWGNLVRGATSHTGPWPTVSIWHGASDSTVNSMNLTELLEQWTNVHGIDRTADATSTVGNATRKQYTNSSGTTLVETWSVSGMGHAVAIDPGTAAEQCGTTGTYASDQNVCSSYQASLYWGILGGGGGGGGGGGDDGGGGGGGDDGGGGGGGHQCTATFANNYQHVQAGRAYEQSGYTYALGSNQYMGLYNTFYTQTLAETAPAYYVIGNCP
jgi:poly(hydroxyalkanoate) depolymerase family esterase